MPVLTAEHVYTSLPATHTVIEYLCGKAAVGKKEQEILCLAGLLLSDHNVLVLDEPGNHLDVDTVDALVEALVDYQGTVVFTSHDRHFTTRVATGVVEVRDGRVTTYNGRYEDYVYRVNKEVDDGEREAAAARPKPPPGAAKPAKAAARPGGTSGTCGRS